MTSDSTTRKYDMDAYIEWANTQCGKAGIASVQDDTTDDKVKASKKKPAKKLSL